MAPVMFYTGLFLITACTLMLQVIQTRILSVVAWYHLAFFAISMAMFGLTAGAVWVYQRRERFTQTNFSYDLAYYSSAFAAATALCFLSQSTLTPIVGRNVSFIWSWVELAVFMSVPFFFSGVVVSLALTRGPFSVGRVYAVDLAGAAAGCLGVLLLLNATDAPSAILWVAAFGAAASSLFAAGRIGTAPDPRPSLDFVYRYRIVLLAILVVCAFINGRTLHGMQPLVVKGNVEASDTYLYREWNTFSRIAVYPMATGTPTLWGPSPKFDRNLHMDEFTLDIDGSASTYAYRFGNDMSKMEFLKYDVTTLAYQLPGHKRAAVIGVGGGRDVLSAAVFGIPDITGVEINPIFVKLLTSTQSFSDYPTINQVPGIHLVVDEGRSWFARTDQQFDTIQMSLIDTWAATGAGAFSLTENGLYTVEAWKTFLGKLSPHGVFTVSRWYRGNDATETARLLSLATATLLELGAREPARQIFLAGSENIATLILAKEPFSEGDLKTLHDAVAFYDYRVIVGPDMKSDSELLQTIVGIKNRAQLENYTSHMEFDFTPPTDDRPFFFNQLPLNKPVVALDFARRVVGTGNIVGAGIRSGNLVATATLIMLFLVSLVLVAATIVVPLRPAIRDVGRDLVIGGTLYFSLIGIGFMSVEIGLLQRMSVFLGHPVYALSVLLFSLMLTTGAGSLISDKMLLNGRRKFAVWSLLTGTYIFSLRFLLPAILLAFDSVPLVPRSILCVVTIAPAGLLMGFGFPTGMRLISQINDKPTPWFWGINGAMGVLASVAAVATSIAFGISTTLMIGALCYYLLIPTVGAFFRQGDMKPLPIR